MRGHDHRLQLFKDFVRIVAIPRHEKPGFTETEIESSKQLNRDDLVEHCDKGQRPMPDSMSGECLKLILNRQNNVQRMICCGAPILVICSSVVQFKCGHLQSSCRMIEIRRKDENFRIGDKTRSMRGVLEYRSIQFNDPMK
jgi:hypothetical protein